ncbi:MAG: IS1380 family transposase, partial [Burkholderiales bacterium]
RLADCLDDAREPGKVLHETIELLQQRIFGLCGGYADCNDAARLGHDPIHKLVMGRDPLTGLGLASQPTLSRFENAVSARELRTMTHVLADTVIAQQRRRLHGRVTRITIDLDPTDDPTHGQQEFAFFNGHYDTWCYLPVVATVTFNDEPAQFAVAAVLRPGKASAGLGARGILRSLLRKLRAAFPAATFRVRLDGGFASPKLFLFLDREQVEYVVGMPSNRRLEKRARRLMGRARVLSRQCGETAHLYGETRYAAQQWTRRRRVIIKAEVVRHPGRAPKNNPRFVVTNLPNPPRAVYEFYCQRGDVENRLKELHHGLELDRTSCSKFRANQFRVLLTLAAYILFQELRRRAATTVWADAQVTTLRERLIKLAVWVERSARRIVLHLPRTFPWLPTWQQLARAVGATS